MPSGPAITLGLGPKIGPKGKRKRKGGRRCCTHVCVVAVQGRAGVVTGLCHSSRRVIYDDTKAGQGESSGAFAFRTPPHSSALYRERDYSFAHLHHQMQYASIHPVHVASTTFGCGVVFAYLADSPCDRRARGHVHDHPSPPRAPRASPAPPTTRVSRSVHTSGHVPGRADRAQVSTLPPLHDARVDMAAMVQAQPTATGAKSIADLQKLLATMKLASSRSRRVDRQLDDVTEAVNSFKATTSTQGEKLAALEKSYFTLLERVVGSEGDKAESGRGKAKSKPGGKGGGGIGGKGGNDSSGGPGASPDGKNASASPDGKSRDAKSDARSKAGGRSASKGGSRADTGAGAGGAGTESRIEAESPRGGEEGDSRKGKGRGKGGGNGGGRRGEDDLPRDLPDGSAAPSRAEAKSSMPHESDDDTPGKDGGGRGSGKGGRSNSRRGKGKEGGAADPDPNAAPLSPIRPNAITSSS